MSECRFCQDYAWNVERARKTDRELTREDAEKLGHWQMDQTAAIVVRHWFTKRGKRSAGRTVQFWKRGRGYPLNYCPECGRKLTGEKDGTH